MKLSVKDAKDFWLSLPGWARGFVGAAVVIIPSAIGYTIYKNSKDKKEQQKALKNLLQTKKDFDIESSKNPATFSETQFIAWGDELQQAFSGCDFSSHNFTFNSWPNDIEKAKNPFYYSKSGKKVIDIINKLNNNTDFIGLALGFGERTYNACPWGEISNATLYKAIIDELADHEVRALNTVLKSKNITYSF